MVCNEGRKEVAVHQSIAGKQIDRTFTFDKVRLGPTRPCILPYSACILMLMTPEVLAQLRFMILQVPYVFHQVLQANGIYLEI